MPQEDYPSPDFRTSGLPDFSFFRVLIVVLAMALLRAEDPAGPFKQGIRYATITFPNLVVYVPAAQSEALRPVAARAAAIYTRMCADAGYTPESVLRLVLSDDEDGHNGFSTVLPLPLVNVQLGPSQPEESFFSGDDETARTLIHEFAHHLSNERNRGWRGKLGSFFGRVLPNDPVSLIVFMFASPNHVLSPPFWHEGLAQWAETTYADPTSAWGGRGRDSLTHMIWRLDTAAHGTAPASDWRLSYVRWPYGSEAYIYGVAYTRWLSGAFGDRRGLWRMVDDQGQLNAPFAFDAGSESSVGYNHDTLITLARRALEEEQLQALAQIATQPVTHLSRRTPVQWRLGAPAWRDDGGLMYAARPPTARPAIYTQLGGEPQRTSSAAWGLDGVRRVSPGVYVHAVAAVGSSQWGRSRIVILRDGKERMLQRERVFQPDARDLGNDVFAIAAIALLPAARQELTIARSVSRDQEDWTTIPTQGRPWSPIFRPGADELAWVETDRDGSRLVLAGFDGAQRKVLWQVRGRIMHPVWSADGSRVFCASDVSGVANGWCVPLSGAAMPVTNSIGGVLAVVPSPNDQQLAILDHDADGPFIGTIANDPLTWPGKLTQIALSWPAPIARMPLGSTAVGADQADPIGPVPSRGDDPPPALPYHALAEIRPRFWTPTSLVVPEGGFGVIAVATDPLLTQQVNASVGQSYHEHEPVGLLSWTSAEHHIEFGALVKRSELVYNEQALASNGRFYDYNETIDTYEARVGWGLVGAARRFHGWLGIGIDDHRTVPAAADEYTGYSLQAPRPFVGSDHYLEATIAFDSSMLFPMSYAREDGATFALTARTSRPRGNSLMAQGSYSLPVSPEAGHQIVTAVTVGWSDGPRDLQGRFGVGGDAVMGLPRGYPLTMSRGRALEAASAAYRFPLLRAFSGCGTSPLVLRQLVVEGFYDAARAGDELGQGAVFRSVGAEVHGEFEFWLVRLDPGLGIAKQVDGIGDTVGYFTLGFRW